MIKLCSIVRGKTCIRVTQQLNYIHSSRLISEMCSNDDRKEKQLSIPELVRGMVELETTKFMKLINFPVIEIDAKDVNAIRGKVRLEAYLLKNLGNIKNLMNSINDKNKRLLVFDPDTVSDDNDNVRQEILSKISDVLPDKSYNWSKHSLDITFDDWDMRRIIRAVLPMNLDFSSFTQTGHIIHCNFRDDMQPYKKIIGQILLRKVNKCRTVVNKIDGITSEFRNFEIELVAGEPEYVAEVLEGGMRYKLDFSKVFWNSRLSFEHERVMQFFNSRSLIFDACAGVGPFVIPVVKKVHARKVVANDLNPESVRWLKENLKLNKIISSEIDVHNMDAVDFIKGPFSDDLVKAIKIKKSDPELAPTSGAHILMNLPAYAINFLPAFKGILHNKLKDDDVPEDMFPIIIYCYLFVKAHEEVPDEYFSTKAKEYVLEKLDCPDADIKLIHHIRTVSSRKEMFCVQVQVPLKFLRESNCSDSEPEAKKLKLDNTC